MQMPASGASPEIAIAPRLTEDAHYWRCRANEALEVAYELNEAAAISKMLKIGRRYERLARRAEERERASGANNGLADEPAR